MEQLLPTGMRFLRENTERVTMQQLDQLLDRRIERQRRAKAKAQPCAIVSVDGMLQRGREIDYRALLNHHAMWLSLRAGCVNDVSKVAGDRAIEVVTSIDDK